MYTDLAMENDALRDLIQKKTVEPTARKEAVGYLVEVKRLSKARACRAVGLSRSGYYQPVKDWKAYDAAVVAALNEVVAENGRWGFWKCFGRIRLDGYEWNHKRVHRVYCEMNLNLPSRTKRRRIKREPVSMKVVWAVNESWSMDFMQDRLYQGQAFRTLNVLDEGVREALAIEVDTSLPAGRVIRVLEQLKAWRGLPKQIRVDNGPELLAEELLNWCKEHGVNLLYIQPGKPNQNAFIERFNRTYRHEVLDAHLFDTLEEVRDETWQWLRRYNERRPHDALGGIPPSAFREKIQAMVSASNLST